MKKILCLILTVLLVLSFAGCEEWTRFTGGEVESGDEGTVDDISDGADLADDPTAFTVCLRYANGEIYVPGGDKNVTVQWTDGYKFYTAKIGPDGYARIKDIDGDYQVTLDGLPTDFVYNPNIYMATNEKRNVEIYIYKPTTPTGAGLNEWDTKRIKDIGVFRATLTEPGSKIFFEYVPTKGGTYTVESWVSTAEGKYNPKIDVYYSSIGYKSYAYTLNDGGVCDGYTQNFKHKIEVAEEQVDKGGGGAVFVFAIHADSKNGTYPINIDFAIQLNGSFDLDHAGKTLVIPKEDFKKTPDYDMSEYTFVGAETSPTGVNGRYLFDGDMYKLWSKKDGGDGYYHLYDAETDTYGAILYAKISQAHRFGEMPFTTIEDAGNSCLTIYGTDNHKLFIEGLEDLLYDPLDYADNAAGGSYFCLHNCPCRVGDGTQDGEKGIGVCGESCKNCLEGCRHLPDELVAQIGTDLITLKNADRDEYDKQYAAIKDAYIKQGLVIIRDTHNREIAIPKCLAGYASYTNSDGVYAVTEEIKDFLQGFSISQRYFADGQGWVETHPDISVDASEADQWLFACGYYKKNN